MANKAKENKDAIRAEQIAGMREVLDFIEANPGIPLPHMGLMLTHLTGGFSARAAIAEMVEDDTTIEADSYSKDYASFTRKFGGYGLRVSVKSSDVGVYSPPRFTPHTIAEIKARGVVKETSA